MQGLEIQLRAMHFFNFFFYRTQEFTLYYITLHYMLLLNAELGNIVTDQNNKSAVVGYLEYLIKCINLTFSTGPLPPLSHNILTYSC